MLKKYCGGVTIWTYPPLAPYVTISHHFRVPLSLSPGDVLFGRPLMLYSFNIWNF